jgi:ParB-like nuclease domain
MPTNTQPYQYTNDSQQTITLPVRGLTWALLNQRHDSYDKDRIKKLKLLLHGGEEIVKCAKMFMPRWKAESQAAYDDRLCFATYENNFGEIVNDLGSTLFSKPIAVLEATDADDSTTPGDEADDDSPHMQWQQHFTLDDQKMADFFHDIQVESNATSCAYYGVDFKEDGKTPYAYCIDSCSVLDYEKDDAGDFIFIILRDDECKRTKVRQLRDSITTTFSVWTRDVSSMDGEDDAVVRFEQYQITYPKDQEPTPDQLVTKIKTPASDEPLSFKTIPIIDCVTPDNLAMAKLIGQPAGSLFMRYSTFLFCLNRGLNPILVYKQGAELPANGDLSEINEDGERGASTVRVANQTGKAVIGPNDELQWAEVPSAAFEVAQNQLDKDKNELYRLASSLTSIIGHAGVSTAQTRSSGEAKSLDNAAKEHLLAGYSKLVKEWILRGFKIVFEALGQDVEWQCKGMDNYKVVDQDQLIAKIAALPEYKANMPSKTSYKQLLMDTAYEVHPFTNVGTMDKIQQEIADNVDAMELDEVHTATNASGAMEADGAKQLNKAVPPPPGKPGSKSAASPAVNAPGGSDMPTDGDAPPLLGKSGNMSSIPGSHLSSGEHVHPQEIYDQLAEDYKDKYIQWVKTAPWKGPMEVSLTDIDSSNKMNWQATDEPDHVDDFVEMLKNGEQLKPIILANESHNNKPMVILDGHHRFLAYQQLGMDPVAYVAEVGTITDEMKQMHSRQTGSKQQSSQQSMQKDISKQVSQSEKAVEGKAK